MPRILSFLLSASTILLLTAPASGQSMRARMMIGVSGYTLEGDGSLTSERIYRLAGGGGLDYRLGSALSLRAELRYTIQGGRMAGTIDGTIGGEPTAIPVDAVFDLTYLEIPILLVAGFDLPGGSRLELGAGPGLGLRVDTRSRFSAETGPELDQGIDGPGRINGLAASIDYIFPWGSERVLLGVRGWKSSTNAGIEETVPGAEDLYTTGFTVLSGIVF